MWVRGTPFGRLVVPLVCRSSAKSSALGLPGMERDDCGTPVRRTAPDDSTFDGHIGKLSPAAASITAALLLPMMIARGCISSKKIRSSSVL